jgi:hypothetical protein
MAGQEVTVPSFEFSSFLYPDILEALILFKRQNAPELTDESEFEPLIQMLRAFALVGHLNNVLIDVIANETTLPTANLPETIRNMLRLIDYELSPASPAVTDLVYKLNSVIGAATEVVPLSSQAATRRTDADSEVIFYEANVGVTVQPTNVFGAAFTETTVFADVTSQVNTGAPPWTWTPFSDNDKLYFIHQNAMWNEMDVEASGTGNIVIGVWEFFDNDFSDVRNEFIFNLGSTLRFYINNLLGTQKRAGANVRVLLNETQVSEEATSQWDGSSNFVDVTFLGQASPSTDPDDYSVGVQWQELDNVDDGTVNLEQDGVVSFDLPQSTTRNWETTEINGFTGFAIRFRVVEQSGGSAPTMGRVRMDTGDQFVTTTVTQGRSQTAEVLGSSNGTPDQRFESAREFFITDSDVLRVDASEWTRVDSFLESTSQDEHYVVELGENDKATFAFGDGSNGKIPPIGQGNVEVDYRWNAELDGNVGANTIIVDKQGLTFVTSLFNPRQAAGWTESEAGSTESLENAKVAGPANLRIVEVALGPDDIEDLSISFTDSNGSSPVIRAKAVEEGFGVKTVKLVAVGSGGGLITASQLTELDTFFNGDPTAVPVKRKRVVANQEVTSVNYTPKVVDVTAQVEVPADSGITIAQIENQLSAILKPDVRNVDGVTFVWQFGGKVPTSRLTHEIFEVDELIRDVDITVPAADIQLGGTELPLVGTLTITLVEV